MIESGKLNLEKLAETLLWESECVILPGLGGLIRRDNPASLNPATHVVKPKSKSFFFNPTIHQTDGMLANYLSENYGVSYTDAVKMIDHEVSQIKKKIASGEKIKWESLGEFFGSAEKTFFIPKTKINFDRETYGLVPVQLKPIAEMKEVAPESVIEKEPVIKSIPVEEPKIDYTQTELQPEFDQPVELPAEKSNFRFVKWVAAAAVVGTLIFFGIRNEGKTHTTQKAANINFDLVDENNVESTEPYYPESTVETESTENKELDLETIPDKQADETWTEEKSISRNNEVKSIDPLPEVPPITQDVSSDFTAEAGTDSQETGSGSFETKYTFNLQDQYHIIVFKSVIKSVANQMLEDPNLYHLPISNSFIHRIGIVSSNQQEELENLLDQISVNYPKAEIIDLKAYEKL